MNKLPNLSVVGDLFQTIRPGNAEPCRLDVGGDAIAIASAIASHSLPVTLFSAVGSDERGTQVLDQIRASGISTDHIAVLSGAMTSADIIDNTSHTARHLVNGASLSRRVHLDVDRLFGADVTVLALSDKQLLRFLIDLPVHTYPATKVLGLLSSWSRQNRSESLRELLRADAIAGTSHQAMQVTGQTDAFSAIRRLQQEMRFSNARTGAIMFESIGVALLTPEKVSTHALNEELGPCNLPAAYAQIAVDLATRQDPASIAERSAIALETGVLSFA